MWSWFLVSYWRVKSSHKKKREQCKRAQYKHKSGYRTGPNCRMGSPNSTSNEFGLPILQFELSASLGWQSVTSY
jgi:hypothetical protein